MVAYSVATKRKNIQKYKKTQGKPKAVCRVSLSSIVSLLVLIVAVLGVLYVVQINRLATMGYKIKEKENQVNLLHKDNEALKIRVAELKSIHQLELQKEAMNLKKPQEIGYLEIDGSVAMGR